MSFSATWRQQLARLLFELGPDAPTLCDGWTTRDLAVHLWIRENKPLAAAGMVIPLLRGYLRDTSVRQRARQFDEVVGEWAAGPPLSHRLIDAKVNAVEHFVHLEDVRRVASGTAPLELSAAAKKELYAALRLLARWVLGASESPIVIYPDGFDRVVAVEKRGVSMCGNDVVCISGQVGELLLWLFGRDVAQVVISGDTHEAGASRIRRRSF
ncbi:MAG: TIGR03085 family metal-binding protein [Corynebacterium sp.]|nr:TIGR03085 family metal-binding protein [Corynebacterium sp.]